MAELNLKQIIDKLNSEFVGDVRKLVFWYDADAEFKEDIDSIELDNAKVLHLEHDNQFYIKYFLECEDTTTNYLVYAPFAKPGIRDNHLADTIKYSKEFSADRATLIVSDLGIDERYKSVIQHYNKFFNTKERTQKFYDMEIDVINRGTIEVALLSVLCKLKTCSIEEVARCVLTDDRLENNKFLQEFEKYDLLEAFWKQVDMAFGYSDDNPSLEKLLMTMFITCTTKKISADLPNSWNPYISYKTGNIIVFVESLMNSVIYRERYDELADKIYRTIDGDNVIGNMDTDYIINCNLFSAIDKKIIEWMIARLNNEDIGAKAGGKTIPELCEIRRKMHFGEAFKSEYYVIENAYYIIADGKYSPVSGIKNVVKNYLDSYYKIDRRYRYFYYHYDQLEYDSDFESLRDLVENIYTNDYLNHITVNWNQEYVTDETGLKLQRRFFMNKVDNLRERTVVIISDALRYEVAHTLYEKLVSDEKCTVSIDALEGVLPSYTPLGMASLLPHKTIEYTDSYEVLVDVKKCASTEQRQTILQSYKPNSRCVQFDAIKNMKQKELRDIFTGQEVIYVYHNQIDARGDAAKTENEVFIACEEAVKEIHNLIRKLSSTANTHHFYVTADHGFIYKRDKIEAHDKIGGVSGKDNSVGQRYSISQNPVEADGVCHTTIGTILGNDDTRAISYPLASDIFKVPGAGQNYVHGGSSPQEMIVPLVEVKVEKGKMETTSASIDLVSLTSKITNLITTLDFVQTEPVSDVVKKASYRIQFISEDGEAISNENILIADKRDTDTTKRMYRFRFNFKNQQYDKTKKYYLVAFDTSNDMEVLRREIQMDIAFADDFGFF